MVTVPFKTRQTEFSVQAARADDFAPDRLAQKLCSNFVLREFSQTTSDCVPEGKLSPGLDEEMSDPK